MNAKLRRAFTLLEMLVAVSIMFILLMVVVPSFSGYYADRLLMDRMEQFNSLVLQARAHSMASDAPAYLVITPTGMALEPRPTTEDGFGGIIETDEEGAADGFFPVARGSRIELRLPYTLAADIPERWTFWPSGNCEPAIISYKGPEGEWTLEYNPMSADYRVKEYAITTF